VDPDVPLFQTDDPPVLIVTTVTGGRHLATLGLPKTVHVVEGSDTPSLSARAILEAIAAVMPSSKLILIEGGPHLMGDFIAERRLDELFLTLSPQIGGRESSLERLGFVAGKVFSPEHPVWGRVISVKRSESHLFLRYGFESVGAA
jgi:riboflavin biosynthesis pyrimidine reductase